jgi:hypothetical protein
MSVWQTESNGDVPTGPTRHVLRDTTGPGEFHSSTTSTGTGLQHVWRYVGFAAVVVPHLQASV